MGAEGDCMMLGNVAPTECREVVRLTIAGRLQEARAIQMRLVNLDWQILALRAAGLKAALNLLGFATGSPRSHRLACSAAQIQQIRDSMVREKLLG